MNYLPDSFEIISLNDLGLEHFKRNPLWSELYDHDESDEIISWGVNRSWLKDKISQLPEHPHPCYTVLKHSPLPERMRLYFYAEFKTAGGNSLVGYFINESPYAIGVFGADGLEVTLNRNLPIEESDLATLRKIIDDYDDPIFPLKYKSTVRDESGSPISGTFATDA